MNARLPLIKNIVPQSAWLLGAICWFGKTRLDGSNNVFNQVDYDENLARLIGFSLADFESEFSNISLESVDFPESILQAAQYFNWQAQDLFLLCLCAELENDYWLNLAIQELQGIQDSSYPKLHFMCALIEALFGITLSPSGLASHSLVDQQFLVIEGAGPLALCAVGINRNFWLALTNRRFAEGLVKPHAIQVDRNLSENELLQQDQIQVLDHLATAIRLRKILRIKLSAEMSQGLSFAKALSARLNLTPLRPSQSNNELSQHLGWLAFAHQWLLIFDQDQTEIFNQLSVDLPVPAILISKQSNVSFNGYEKSKKDLIVEYKLDQDSSDYRKKIWRRCLDEPLALQLAKEWLINQSQIEMICAVANIDKTQFSEEQIKRTLYKTRLALAPHSLNDLAVLIPYEMDPKAVVFSSPVEQELIKLLQRCRHRESMFDHLGNSATAIKNKGVRAVFSGESGTGKSLAAAYLASQLAIPLYRLDLGAILNKYIGETEKNIHNLLEQCAANDYILLIDEADALFGKRTDADTNGERFSNMLTNYLLTRIETYPGIVFMTTNGMGRIDSAFLRRFDSIVQFTSPELEERARIWQTHLGARSPGDDYCRQLASLCDLSGGFIRNAVFSAAAETPATQEMQLAYPQLLQAIASEYRKSGKPLPAKLVAQLSAVVVQA